MTTIKSVPTFVYEGTSNHARALFPRYTMEKELAPFRSTPSFLGKSVERAWIDRKRPISWEDWPCFLGSLLEIDLIPYLALYCPDFLFLESDTDERLLCPFQRT